MALKEDFQSAAERVKKLSKRPTNEQLLALYSLYKQATEGDVNGQRPGMFDLKGRAKYDAWAAKKNTPQDKAMQDYVALVQELEAKS